MNFITKILKESEENNNIFQPRRIEKRLDNLDPLTKKMLTEFSKGKEIKVYIPHFKNYYTAIITQAPKEEDENDEEGAGSWYIWCDINLEGKKFSKKTGSNGGWHHTICWWYNNIEHFVCYNNSFLDPTNWKRNARKTR